MGLFVQQVNGFYDNRPVQGAARIMGMSDVVGKEIIT